MPATKVNLSQMVDLAVVTPREGAVNSNALHTLLHAMLKQLNIVDVQAETNLSDYDRDFLSASKARELSVLSDIDSGVGDDAEDAPSLGLGIDRKRSSLMPTPRLRTGKRTPHHQVASIQEELINMTSVPSNKHLFKKPTSPFKGKPIAEMWLSMLLFRVQTNEKGIDKCMSMIEDMTKEMQALRDEQKMQMDQIKGLNIDDVMKRINAMEKSMADMRKKLDQGALDGLNVSSGILEQLQELKEKVAARERISDPIQDLLLRHEHEMHTLTITELQMKFAMLEDDLYQIQDMIELKLQNGNSEEFEKLFAYRDELQVDKADRTEVDVCVVTYRDELQVDKADRTEVDVVTCRDELQVDKADRTEVDVVTYRDELQVDKADRTEVDVVTYRDELQVDKADRTEVDVATFRDELQVDKADRTEVDVATYHDELQVNKADRTEVDVATRCDELQVDKADRTEVDIATYCDELQVNKADRTEVDVKADKRTLENHSLFDTNTNDINKMIKKILINLAVKDEAWNQQCKVFSDDIDRKLNHLELKSIKEWLQRRLKALNDQLNEQNQAPVRRLKALNDQLPTGNTSTCTSSSGSNSLFDTETNDISKMIKEILNIIAVNEEAWNQQCKVFSDDIDRKLDRVELKPVKEWLLKRLKALNDKLKKQNQGHVRKLKALNDKLPIGPVPSSMPSVSSHQALHPTISPRPDLNFEMDQILPHAKSDTVKQQAKTRKSGQKVFKFISKMTLKPFRKAKSQ